MGEGIVQVTKYSVGEVRLGDVVSADACYMAPKDLKGEALQAALKPVEVARAAPVRVLAWDVETWCQPLGDGAMKFYDGDDPGAKLLCVSAVMFDYGIADSTESLVFSLGDGPAAETQETATDGSTLTVRWFGVDERGLMRAFFNYVNASDPDVVTGWNTYNFDWPWLAKRAEALGLLPDINLMARWGHVKFDFTEKARQVVEMPGRELHDGLAWFKKNRNLRSYSLDSVATEFSLDGKDDVEYSQISELFQTHAGRVKLAVYCALDSRLVTQLLQLPQVDALGRTLAISAITGVVPEHALNRGSMNTLRLALLRASHAAGYVLSCPARGNPADEKLLADGDDSGDSRYQGGKVLSPVTGFYRDPVATLDFSSLYPSIMMEANVCSSTRLTLAQAQNDSLSYNQPPAPCLSGIWWRGTDKVAKIHEESDTNISIYSLVTKKTQVAKYSTELNESITLPGGATWQLENGGYALRLGDEVWHRAPKDILVFVDPSVRPGIIPELEKQLKADRKAAKRRLAAAEAAGDKAAAVYWDNLQNGIKVLMNALYGGLGSARGGIFPESAPLASAITARGRSLICTVKREIESKFFLMDDGTLGGLQGEPLAAGGKHLRVLYGDTVRPANPPSFTH
jgi:DNA polymerase elongation subunit (family B)